MHTAFDFLGFPCSSFCARYNPGFCRLIPPLKCVRKPGRDLDLISAKLSAVGFFHQNPGPAIISSTDQIKFGRGFPPDARYNNI